MKSIVLITSCFILLSFSSSVSASSRNWVETSSWFGRGPMTTRFFRVAGDRWRIHYVNHGPGSLQIQVFNRDHERVHEIFTRQDRPGIRTVPLEEGEYYLVIEPSDTRWEVLVRQRISRIQEWFLREETEKFHAGLERFASFSGTAGQAVYPISVPHGSWRVVYTNSRHGRLQFWLNGTDEGNDYSFYRLLNSPKRTQTWIHRPGDFVLQLNAVDTRWRIDLYHVPQTAME